LDCLQVLSRRTTLVDLRFNSPGELFSSPDSSSTDEEALSDPVPIAGSRRTGHHALQAQAGSHSPTPSRSGPAGNKKHHVAKDVWEFYEIIASKRHCLFCQYI